jgi:hypothetical protein
MMIIAVFSLIWFIDGFDKISKVVLIFGKLHFSQTNMKYMLNIMFYIHVFQLFKYNKGILNKFPLQSSKEINSYFYTLGLFNKCKLYTGSA